MSWLRYCGLGLPHKGPRIGPSDWIFPHRHILWSWALVLAAAPASGFSGAEACILGVYADGLRIFPLVASLPVHMPKNEVPTLSLDTPHRKHSLVDDFSHLGQMRNTNHASLTGSLWLAQIRISWQFSLVRQCLGRAVFCRGRQFFLLRFGWSSWMKMLEIAGNRPLHDDKQFVDYLENKDRSNAGNSNRHRYSPQFGPHAPKLGKTPQKRTNTGQPVSLSTRHRHSRPHLKKRLGETKLLIRVNMCRWTSSPKSAHLRRDPMPPLPLSQMRWCLLACLKALALIAVTSVSENISSFLLCMLSSHWQDFKAVFEAGRVLWGYDILSRKMFSKI